MAFVPLKYFIFVLFFMKIVNRVFGQEAREPICSRFHYEEMLLEKMIRLEHSAHLMMEEFRRIQTKVDNNLVAVSQATENMKSSVEHALEMQRNISEKIKQDAEHANKQLKEKLEHELEIQRNASKEIKQIAVQATEDMKEKLHNEMQTSKDLMAKITGKATCKSR